MKCLWPIMCCFAVIQFPFFLDNDYSVRPATNSMPVFIKDVRCSGREMSLLECGFRRNLTHSVHLEDVGVKCKKCKILTILWVSSRS